MCCLKPNKKTLTLDVLTRPTGAADQQRRTLCPPGHGVISEVTRCENRFLRILLLLLRSRGGKADQSEQNVCFTVKPETLGLSERAVPHLLLWNWGCVLASLRKSSCCTSNGVSLKKEAGLSYRVVALQRITNSNWHSTSAFQSFCCLIHKVVARFGPTLMW